MAQPYVRTLAAVAVSNACPHDHAHTPFNLSLDLVFTGTATAKVQYTLDDLATATDAQGSNLTWFDHATLTGAVANAVGNIAFPVRATRLNVTAWTSGNVTMTALQAGR
jgi:hypothetical protein